MKKDDKNIEDLFRESLSGYKIEPSSEVWEKINFKLNFKDFFSANLRTPNIYYLALITGVVTCFIFLFSNDTKVVQNKSKLFIDSIRLEKKEKTLEKIDIVKIDSKKKKEAISYPTEVYTQNDFKIAKDKQNTELLPLPLKKHLNEFSKLYGDSLNKIGAISVFPPKPLFTLISKAGCAPFEINLKNQTQMAQYYEWSFGDGSNSTKVNPSYTYQYPGIYTIRLKAIGIGGIAYSIIDSVIVYDWPKNKVQAPSQSDFVEGERIHLSNESQNTIKYEWNFGDGSISTQKKPDHVYQTAGNYTIVLKSWTDKNCIDSVKVADVRVVKMESLIAFPNAFYSNPDGSTSGIFDSKEIYNYIFHPIVRDEIAEYQIKIYTREGALVYESDNILIGWDGYYKKKRMPAGVYPYIAKGKFEGGRNFLKKGNVTIIYRH